MAEKKNSKNSQPKGDYFTFSVEKKKKLIGIFLLLLGLIILLSILTYSRYDQANLRYSFSDLFKVFSNEPEFAKRVDSTNNWLGIFGAYISDFFINGTLGYFAIVFPLIVLMWGYSIARQRDYKLAIYVSNFLIVMGLLFATLFGLFRFLPNMKLFEGYNEVSGKVGLFIGTALGRLLGGIGGTLLILTLAAVTLIIAFDVKFGKIFDYFIGLFKERGDDASDIKIKKAAAEEEVKLKAEAPVKEKKGKSIFGFGKGTEVKAEEPPVEKEPVPETKIRIVKRDNSERIVSDIPEDNDEPASKKKADKHKRDDDEEVIDKTKEASFPEQWDENIKFIPPKLDLLNPPKDEDIKIPETELKKNAALLKEKLSLFDIQIDDITVTPGPVVTLYEIVPAPGVKISRIVSLENDIALALAARGIRIIAPIPGKSAIGVEIPNAEATLVCARSVIAKVRDSKAELPLALGKTIAGDVYITDLAKMPHLLIAGSTGSGKSVGINMIINSLIYAKHPSDVKFVIVDPKKIELSFYKRLNKHYLAMSPDLEEEIITSPSNALLALKSVEYEMEKRYDKLAKIGVRNIVDYNEKVADPKRRPKDTDEMKHYKMPYIIVIIDELADLMITSGKEVEEPIARLAQLARAVGIHLIVATQRPSVNVITGVIKANFSARMAYQVATKIDSRTILDMNGAEQLLGRGDMLFLPGGMPKPIRIQNAFISTDEVEKVVNSVYIQEGYSKRFFLPSLYEKKMENANNLLSELDPMFEDAARVVVRHQQGSVSLLQRRLKLGYSRAARIVDQMEQAGIVGPSEGSKAREVIIENEEQLETVLRNL
jgi:S-DNA-T family DNA segregation ATPase FtsK/SpoIIIE